MITLYKYLEAHYGEDRDQLLSLVRAREQEVMLCAAEGNLDCGGNVQGATPQRGHQGMVCPGLG